MPAGNFFQVTALRGGRGRLCARPGGLYRELIQVVRVTARVDRFPLHCFFSGLRLIEDTCLVERRLDPCAKGDEAVFTKIIVEVVAHRQ